MARGSEVSEATAVQDFYDEQWFHEHRDELPGDMAEYIERLQLDRDEAVQETDELQEQLRQAWYQLAELRKPVRREAQG